MPLASIFFFCFFFFLYSFNNNNNNKELIIRTNFGWVRDQFNHITKLATTIKTINDFSLYIYV